MQLPEQYWLLHNGLHHLAARKYLALSCLIAATLSCSAQTTLQDVGPCAVPIRQGIINVIKTQTKLSESESYQSLTDYSYASYKADHKRMEGEVSASYILISGGASAEMEESSFNKKKTTLLKALKSESLSQSDVTSVSSVLSTEVYQNYVKCVIELAQAVPIGGAKLSLTNTSDTEIAVTLQYLGSPTTTLGNIEIARLNASSNLLPKQDYAFPMTLSTLQSRTFLFTRLDNNAGMVSVDSNGAIIAPVVVEPVEKAEKVWIPEETVEVDLTVLPGKDKNNNAELLQRSGITMDVDIYEYIIPNETELTVRRQAAIKFRRNRDPRNPLGWVNGSTIAETKIKSASGRKIVDADFYLEEVGSNDKPSRLLRCPSYRSTSGDVLRNFNKGVIRVAPDLRTQSPIGNVVVQGERIFGNERVKITIPGYYVWMITE